MGVDSHEWLIATFFNEKFICGRIPLCCFAVVESGQCGVGGGAGGLSTARGGGESTKDKGVQGFFCATGIVPKPPQVGIFVRRWGGFFVHNCGFFILHQSTESGSPCQAWGLAYMAMTWPKNGVNSCPTALVRYLYRGHTLSLCWCPPPQTGVYSEWRWMCLSLKRVGERGVPSFGCLH